MTILVTGGGGALGRSLRAHWPGAMFLGHRPLDVTDESAVWETLLRYKPSIVLHAAAVTDHLCPHVGHVIRTNVLGTLHIAEVAATIGARLVYCSTHYVYPGDAGLASETDAVRPIGLYAAAKYAGEAVVQSTCPDSLVIRGSWYTPEKLATWRREGALTDAYCSREPVARAAEKIARLTTSDVTGIVNIGGPRRTFLDIALAECGSTRQRRRADLTGLPYDFPPDSSVDTARYDALSL